MSGRRQFHSVGDGAIRYSDPNNNHHHYRGPKRVLSAPLFDPPTDPKSITSSKGSNRHALRRNSDKVDDCSESYSEFELDDDDVFDDVSYVQSNYPIEVKVSKGFPAGPRYKRRQTRSTSSISSNSRSSNGSIHTTLKTRISAQNSIKVHRQRRSILDHMSSCEVIREDQEEQTVGYSRSKSQPSLIKHNRGRLQRRRSAVTFPSTYRTLSAPTKAPKHSIVSHTSSVTSSIDVSCLNKSSFAHSLLRHKHGNWLLWNSCLAHKQEHGMRMSPMQLAIRKSLEKAIQKAGFNMNELAVAGSTPTASPMITRKVEQKSFVDWTENATTSDHIWGNTNASGDLCYVGEEHCTKTGCRKKCSACRIVVHEHCIEQLNKIGFQCKTTFREASSRSSRDNIIVRHHWVHRRKQEGKCKQCGRSFERRFNFRDTKIIAISCSWCKEAYHNKVSCFQMHKISEPCSMGVHARLIVPPNWVLKFSQRQKSVRNRSKKKRNSGNFNRKRSTVREGRQRTFAIRPLLEHTPYLHPTIVFINPKSGGNQGAKLVQHFQWLLNPRQVFDLSKEGPKEALEMYRKVPNLRILACGGDGTVGWILSCLDELSFTKYPPVAIIPLGTGNDLSRTCNWGPGYSDEPISKILQHVEEGKVVQLDRWKLIVEPNHNILHQRSIEEDGDLGMAQEGSLSLGVDQPPLDVVNNYFSIGADAQVSLEFHESREAHPGKFNSRLGNKIYYMRKGVSEYIGRQMKSLYKNISVVCDGIDITPKIREIKPVCILFLNIPKYSSGTEPWGNPAGQDFHRNAHDDKMVEVLAFSLNQMGMLFVGGHGDRLAQCREAVITTNRVLPVQIDGEPCRLNPSHIKFSFLNQANIIYKQKRVVAPQQDSTTEKQKICVNAISLHKYELYNGDKTKLMEVSIPVIAAMVPIGSDLKTTRFAIEDMLEKDTGKISYQLSEHWSFLDLVDKEKFYRIDPSQETLHPVSNIAKDGLIFVLDSSTSPKQREADTRSRLRTDKDRTVSPRHRIHSDGNLPSLKEIPQQNKTLLPQSLLEVSTPARLFTNTTQNSETVKISKASSQPDISHLGKSMEPRSLQSFQSVDETRELEVSIPDKVVNTKTSSAANHCNQTRSKKEDTSKVLEKREEKSPEESPDKNFKSTEKFVSSISDKVGKESTNKNHLMTKDSEKGDDVLPLKSGRKYPTNSNKQKLIKSMSENSASELTLTQFVRLNVFRPGKEGENPALKNRIPNKITVSRPSVISKSPKFKRASTMQSATESYPESLTQFVEQLPSDSNEKGLRKDANWSPHKSNTDGNTSLTDGGADITLENNIKNLNNHSNNNMDANTKKWTKVLLDASKRGDLQKIKMALNNGAKAIAVDGDGCTVMHNAARFNHTEIVKFLISKGLRNLIHLRDKGRMQTPLHKAAWFGNIGICKVLVEAGSSLTVTDYKGMTPLARANQAEDKKLVEYFMQESCKRGKTTQRETDL